MRVSAACLSKGFWGRSLDEFKRLSSIGAAAIPFLASIHTIGLTKCPIAVKLEAITGPTGPYPLFDFHSSEAVKDCKVLSDRDIGGVSQSYLDWVPPNSRSAENPNSHARFHGNISIELPRDKPDIQRTGFAAWRTLDRKGTIFGRSVWDIDPYVYLALRVKSDGRSYLVNVQTESVVYTDLHQHRLFAKRPGEWETVLIKWSDFVRTNHGFVVEPQTELLKQKVRTIGVGLTDRIPGPFELCIERMWATNDLNEAGAFEIGRETDGGLKNKQGESIKWSGDK